MDKFYLGVIILATNLDTMGSTSRAVGEGNLAQEIDDGLDLPTPLKVKLLDLFPGDEESYKRVGGILSSTRKVLGIVESGLSRSQTRNRAELRRLASDPDFYAATAELMDRFSRPDNTREMAKQAKTVLEDEAFQAMQGMEAILKNLFLKFGVPFHPVSVKILLGYIKNTAGKFLLINKGDVPKLGKRIKKMRKKTGIDYTVNIVAEDAHGQKQANLNRAKLIEAIKDPNIHSIAGKPTAICPNVGPYAFEETVARLTDSTVEVLEAIRDNPIAVKPDGTKLYKKFVMDMEDSSTMQVTLEAIKRAALRVPEVPVGVAIQTYMPEAYLAVDDLADFSEKDMEKQGLSEPRIEIRLVKGANMPLEKRNHSKNSSVDPVFQDKGLTDANTMFIERRLVTKHKGKLRVTKASMNVRDLIQTLDLVTEHGELDNWSFQMLKGMLAEENLAALKWIVEQHLGPTVLNVNLDEDALDGKLGAYTPTVIEEKDEEKKWLEGLAYNIRRLQEIGLINCFLNSLLTKGVGSEQWDLDDENFAKSYRFSKSKDFQSFLDEYIARITQDRNTEVPAIKDWKTLEEVEPCPVTNWRFAENRQWLDGIRKECNEKLEAEPEMIGLVVGDPKLHEQSDEYKAGISESTCPARNNRVFAKFERVSEKGVDRMMEIAKESPEWGDLDSRIDVISKACLAVQKNRGKLIGAGQLSTGFTGDQLDGEVSEMVEMYYAAVLSRKMFRDQEGYEPVRKGLTVISCPWNFSLAIVWNGIIEALLNDNPVIVKPAPETEYASYKVVEQLWEAGVPKSMLQFAPCDLKTTAYLGSKAENMVLTGHSNTVTKILEGGTMEFNGEVVEVPPNTYINLSAETGGNNIKAIGPTADLDAVTGSALHELTGKSAQKCSVTRIMMVDESVNLEALVEKFEDGIGALKAESNTIDHLDTDMGPLVLAAKRGDKFDRSWLKCHEGERWLVEPTTKDGVSYTPGIKLCDGLTKSCQEEEFVPVIKIIVVKNIREACKLGNASGHGLTSGEQGLDPDERDEYHENIISGIAYNGFRPQTGAQGVIEPFGGMVGTKSKYGCGAHAAGPDYGVEMGKWKKVRKPAYEARIEGDDNSSVAAVVRNLLDILDEFRASPAPVDIAGMDGGVILKDLRRLIEAGISYRHNFREYFEKGFTPKQLVGQENYYEYKALGVVAVRLTPGCNLYDILAPVMANNVAGNKVILSVHPKMALQVDELQALGLLQLNLMNNVELTYQTEEEFSATIDVSSDKELDFKSRLKAIYYPSDAGAKAEPVAATTAAKNKVWMRRGEFIESGRLALVPCLQGRSISNLYDRFGNIPKRAFTKEQRMKNRKMAA